MLPPAEHSQKPTAMISEEKQRFINSYDLAISSSHAPRLFGDSGFYNIGYWSEDLVVAPENAAAAAKALVRYLASFDAEESRAACTHVLDVACGLGATTKELGTLYPGTEIHGINLSREQIRQARARFPAGKFSVMDATKLQFSDESFDRIYCVEALFYFDCRRAFLKEAYRVLRPGGHLFVSDFLLSGPLGAHVPMSNIGTDPAVFGEHAEALGLELVGLEDISARSVRQFMEIYDLLDMARAAQQIQSVIGGYYIAQFRRPL